MRPGRRSPRQAPAMCACRRHSYCPFSVRCRGATSGHRYTRQAWRSCNALGRRQAASLS
jgi:hypothetical protein